MIKEIKYNGCTAQPSDYESPDGDLALSVGMVPENGSLHPVMPPKVLTTWENVNRVFVHKNNYTHYIVVQNGDSSSLTFKWTDEKFGTLSDTFLTLTGETITDMTAIGNMLVIASSAQMYYVLWKDNAYTFLANSLPRPRIVFALHGEVVAHAYTDRDIEAGKTGVSTTQEGWTVLAKVAYTLSVPKHGGESEYIYLDNTVTLSAETDYAFSTEYSADRATHYFILEGYNGTAYEQIIKAHPRAMANHYTRHIGKDYTKLRLKVSSFVNPASNTLVIERGYKSAVTLEWTIKNTSDNYNALMAIVNTFRNDYADKKGRFMHPFFVRCAMRLYDGAYAHVSPPVLMVPNSGYAPLMHFSPRTEDSGNINVTAYAFVAGLQMRLCDDIGHEWDDIIQGFDIFVSQPVYPYDQGQAYDTSHEGLFTYKVVQRKDNVTIDQVAQADWGYLRLAYDGQDTNDAYTQNDLAYVLKEHYAFADFSQSEQWEVVEVAPRKNEDIMDDISETAAFYLAKSIDIEEARTFREAFNDIDIKKGTLASLATRKALDDELLASRTLLGAGLYAYNNRLHAFRARFALPTPAPTFLTNQYCGKADTGDTGDTKTMADIIVFMHGARGDKNVVYEARMDNADECFGKYGIAWFYYPDNNAYKAVFVSRDRKRHVEVPLRRHSFLNGAYWLADTLHQPFGSPLADDYNGTYDMPDQDGTIEAPETVYVSETGNPFTFRAAMAVAVGCSEVRAIAAAARPLSTGQFGQFPLYAFTDNGVWAMETSSTGSYVARQPITRDICTNVESICQLESSVLFATDRGIMELAGSAAACITDTIKTQFPFSMADLPGIGQLLSKFNALLDADNEKSLTMDNVSVLPFKSFIGNCRIVNDYTNQRIILFNPSVRYAYVFSRQSSAWGMMQSGNVLAVNSYPQAQTIDGDGNLLDYGLTSATRVTALVVTRPFAMGEPDIHKTLSTCIQRGFFRKGNVRQAVYASNDMFNWYLVASSTDGYVRNISGTGYKFFRVVMLGTVQRDESLYGLTVEFIDRGTNQPR